MRAPRPSPPTSVFRHALIAAASLAVAALACGNGDGSGNGGASGGTGEECEGRADTYVPGMTKASSDGGIQVELSSAEPAPPASADANWTLTVRDGAGTPVEGATVVAVPYMIDHGHTAPTRVAVEQGGGSYEVGPLGFFMPGLWEVTLRVQTLDSKQEEDVVFLFCLGG